MTGKIRTEATICPCGCEQYRGGPKDQKPWPTDNREDGFRVLPPSAPALRRPLRFTDGTIIGAVVPAAPTWDNIRAVVANEPLPGYLASQTNGNHAVTVFCSDADWYTSAAAGRTGPVGRRPRPSEPASAWQGGSTVRICSVVDDKGRECAKVWRTAFHSVPFSVDMPLRRGTVTVSHWETVSGCPQHGPCEYREEFRPALPIPGGKSGAPTVKVEHLAWCAAEGCNRTFSEIVRPENRTLWDCPKHGPAHVVGCNLPTVADDGGAGAVLGEDAAGRERYVDVRRGDRIEHGKRGTFAFRAKGRPGNSVRGSLSTSTVAAGKWTSRETAPTDHPAAGYVTVRVAEIVTVPKTEIIGWRKWREIRKLPGRVTITEVRPGAVTRLETATGQPVKVNPPKTATAALVKREATVTAVLPGRTRTAAANATRAASAAKIKGERAASAAKVAELFARAEAMRASKAERAYVLP